MEMYLTTPDRQNLMTKKADIKWGAPQRGLPEFTVDVSKKLQPFLGVGAALTDSSAFLLTKCMSDTAREETLCALFSPAPGAGFSVIRICMGASDFNHAGSYTYCDYPDPTLKMFSIHREQECLIPIIHAIRRINPNITIIASPWSAPAWMKTNNSLNGGWLAQEHYDTYAGYFVKYIDAMRREGINIDYITPQNEPRHNDDRYPSMRMEPSDQARFIGNHLGPALQKANIRTKILCWDHNWDMMDFPMGVLADPDARKYTAGAAFHAYAGEPSAQAQVQKAFPEQEIHFTESSGGFWATDFGGNIRWDLTNPILGSIRYGARTSLKWNLVLDENQGPQNGGCDNCRGIVTYNRKLGAITRNEEFYAFGHVGAFVHRGAHVVGSTAIDGSPNAVFLNRDGGRVLVTCSEKERRVQVIDGKRAAQINIPAGSAITLTWR